MSGTFNCLWLVVAVVVWIYLDVLGDIDSYRKHYGKAPDTWADLFRWRSK